MLKYNNFFVFFILFIYKKNKIDKILSYYLVYFKRKNIFFIKNNNFFIYNNFKNYYIKIYLFCILNKVLLNNLKRFIKIIYEDNYLVLIDKPCNIFIHPNYLNWNNNLIESLINYYGNKILFLFRFGILHRLDKDSSGLMILFKSNKVYINLIKQIKYNLLNKYYFSLNFFKRNINFNKISGYINNFVKKNIFNFNFFSLTKFFIFNKIIYKKFFIFFLKSKLITGRTHQLRLHFNYFNFPIIGDILYNKNNLFYNMYKRHFLHCYNIFFFHPITNNILNFKIPLYKDIFSIINFIFRDGGIWTLDSF